MQHTDVAAAEAFIAKWKAVDASDLATSQPFLIGLCDLLGVDQRHRAQDICEAVRPQRKVPFVKHTPVAEALCSAFE